MIEMMKPEQLIKQMVDFQKATIDSSFNTMTVIQNRMEKMSDMVMEQIMWGSEKWTHSFSEWFKAYQDGFERLKKVADENFAKMENYVSRN